jgi:hypothetical protein
MKSFILSVFFLAITFSLVAQAPQGINYQTVIRNSSGIVLANTNVSIKINIRSNSALGTIVYAETHTVSTNQFGLVNFVIGQGTVITGTFVNINWGNGTYFAETLVDPAGGNAYVTVGAQQLMSVPYALYASKASNSSSWKDTSVIINSVAFPIVLSRNGAIVSSSPFTYGTNIDDGGMELWAPYPAIDFKNNFVKDADMRIAYDSSKAGYLTISTYDSTLINKWKWDQFVFNKDGKMGVGTSSPLNQIHVIGDIRAGIASDSTYILTGGTDGGFVIQRKNDLAYIDFTTDRYNVGGARIQLIENGLRIGTGVAANLERFRILSSGNIGVGNSNPKSKFTVTGGDVNITDIASGIILKSPNGNCWRVTIDNSGNLVRTAITCP